MEGVWIRDGGGAVSGGVVWRKRWHLYRGRDHPSGVGHHEYAGDDAYDDRSLKPCWWCPLALRRPCCHRRRGPVRACQVKQTAHSGHLAVQRPLPLVHPLQEPTQKRTQTRSMTSRSWGVVVDVIALEFLFPFLLA